MQTIIVTINNPTFNMCCRDADNSAFRNISDNTYTETKETITIKGAMQTITVSSVLVYAGLLGFGVTGAVVGGLVGLLGGGFFADSKTTTITTEYGFGEEELASPNFTAVDSIDNPKEKTALEIPKAKTKEANQLIDRIEKIELAVKQNNNAKELTELKVEHTKALDTLKHIALNMPKEEIIDTEIAYKALS